MAVKTYSVSDPWNEYGKADTQYATGGTISSAIQFMPVPETTASWYYTPGTTTRAYKTFDYKATRKDGTAITIPVFEDGTVKVDLDAYLALLRAAGVIE